MPDLKQTSGCAKCKRLTVLLKKNADTFEEYAKALNLFGREVMAAGLYLAANVTRAELAEDADAK